jgi:hypothetical protein
MSEEHPSKEEIMAEQRRKRLATRDAVGIDPDFSPCQLLYIPCAETLVAEVYRRSTPAQEHRLFARRCSDQRYTVIGQPEEFVHFQQAVALPHMPVVYFSVWRTSQQPDGRAGGSNWESLQRLHLEDYRIEPVATTNDLVVPPQYTRSWISELLSITSDGRSVICNCGLERSTGARSTQVDYFLCQLDVASRQATLITQLESIWF